MSSSDKKPKKNECDFSCCGGNDDTPKEHTQDCSVHGNPEWIAEMDHFEETGKYWTKRERKEWKKKFNLLKKGKAI